jgi:hypothetical protein
VFEFLDIHYFHGIHLFILAVLCLVDVAVLPLAYLFLEDIILDDLIHCSFALLLAILNILKRHHETAIIRTIKSQPDFIMNLYVI